MLFGSAPPPEPMGEFTGFLLNWVGDRSRSAFGAGMADLGLRPPQFAVMVLIDARPGLAQQELVSATGTDPSTMVALLDALELAGWAERRPHPIDRRKRALHLTPAGQDTLAAARRVAEKVGAESFGALEPAEFAELHRTLRKLAGLSDA